MANTKSYNELRNANLHENRRMLLELGVPMPRDGQTILLNKSKLPPKRPKQRLSEEIPKLDTNEDDGENKSEDLGRSGSRSFRVRLRPKNYQEEQEECIYDYPKPKPRLPTIRPDPSYGKIPGVEVGREWATRMECSYDLIHRPTVAGIHGGPDGAYSVALSGGYEDDVDFGESFTYTGEGGRDLKGTKVNPKNLRTAPQSKDQTLDRGNLALARSVETKNPVRVVRGYKLDSQYAPEEGYRYDGLYQVKGYWAAKGKSGYKVWKFAFTRCDTEPAPWVQMLPRITSPPTSPTTPASIPQTGVEACEAPSLDTSDCEDYSQVEEAQIGAKHPDVPNRVKKKVRFNSEDSVRIFEKDIKPEESGRMTTRSSSAKVVESEDLDDGDLKPAQLKKRSQRVVKPTEKVLANISLEDDQKPPPKLVNISKLSSSPVVLITGLELPTILKRSAEDVDTPKKSPREKNEDDGSPKKSSALCQPPKAEKSSKIALDTESKRKSRPEDKSGKKPTSPEERPNKSPQSKKLPESASREKSQKESVSPGYSPRHEKPNSPKSLSDEVPRKRSISPDYPPSVEEQKSSKSSSDEIPMKRSISPEYLPEDDVLKKGALGRLKKLSVSPQLSPANENMEKRPRGRPRKSSVSPQHSPVLDDDHPKRSPVDNKPNKTPKSSPQEIRVKRSVSPDYPPENEKAEILPALAAKEKSKRRSKSPEHEQERSFPKNPGKLPKSPDSISKEALTKRSLSPKDQTKTVNKKSKSPKSPTEGKLQEKWKSPTNNASKTSPKSAEVGSKRFKAHQPKKSPSVVLKNCEKDLSNLPRRGKSDIILSRDTSPKKNPSSEKSPGISQNIKSPKTSNVHKTETALDRKSEKINSLKTAVGSRNFIDKTIRSPKVKSKHATRESKAPLKRHLSSDRESAETKVSSKKKLRTDSPHLSSEKPTTVRESADDEEISECELDAPVSPESMEDQPPAEIEGGGHTHTTLAAEPETKKFGKEVPETITPPEIEASNSNSSSPTPLPQSSVLSPARSTSESQAPVLAKSCDRPWNVLDNDEFPSDEEILNMMQISLGVCTSDGPRIVVKMVDGKWIEMEENDSSAKQNGTTAPR